MTAHTTMRVGTYLGWERRIYRITTITLGPPQVLTLEDIQSQEERTAALTEILFVAAATDAPVFGATEAAVRQLLARPATPPAPAHAGGIPANLLVRADGIIATVVAVERAVAQMQRAAREHGEDWSRVAALDQVLRALPLHADRPTEAHQVGRQTYYRYLHRYRQGAGGRSAIAASLHRMTLHQSRMSPAILHLLDLLILRYYARERPMRPQTLYHLLGDVLTRTGGRWIDPATCSAGIPDDLVSELLNPKLPFAAILLHPEKAPHLVAVTQPSRSWFYGYLRYFENSSDQGEAVITARYGHEVWEREHLVFDTFVRQASLPLQYVFADHWLFDAFSVDETTRRCLDRLWLTLLIDAYSRCILGMALLYEAPSIMSLQTALRHAIWPKQGHPTWSCYGIPMQLFLDNAWAHHSHSVEDLARQISQGGQYLAIDLVFRPPYKGRYGAIIERLFGTLSGRVKEHLPGAIQNSSRRAVANAMNQACLLYRDIEQFVLHEIVAYQHRPHSELGGMTPEEKWHEGMRLMGLPVVPPMTTAMERLFWREDPDPRYLHDKGISSFGLNYWSPALARCPRWDASGTRIPYLRRYTPDNISTIAVFRADAYVGDASAQRLRLPDGTYRPVSLSERAMARALVAPGARGTDNWVEHLAEIDDQTKQREHERRQVAKRASAPPVPLLSITAMDQGRDRALVMGDDLYTKLLAKSPTGQHTP